jgi:hypothetical protein
VPTVGDGEYAVTQPETPMGDGEGGTVGGADVDADDGNTGAEREGRTWDCMGGGQPMGVCSPHDSRQAAGEVSEMRDLAAWRRMEERRMILDLARCHHGRADQGLCEGVRRIVRRCMHMRPQRLEA